MKALLMLVGGRPIPNALTFIHEKPDVIVAICSEESFKEEWVQLKQAIKKLSPATTIIKEPPSLDAFNVEAIIETSEHELLEHPDADWVVNITSGTSLMTLGAYIAAERCLRLRDMLVKCWYLDTAHSRVIPLVGEKRDASIFYMEVEQYVAAYNYNLRNASNYMNYRSRYLQEDWKVFARRLGKNPREIDLLKLMLVKAAINRKTSVTKTDDMYQFLLALENAGLVRNLCEEEDYCHFYLSDEQHKFLNGAWLELYVLQEAQSARFFDDIQWHKEIIDNDPDRKAKSPFMYKEMDVALTYKAKLMIVECKTGDGGLDDLVTVADLVGGRFVMKVLVTSRRMENISEDFRSKSAIKGIRIIAQDELSRVGTILKELAQTAKQR